ncbi:ABC transporter ATP-binding protein [Nocardioides sp. cx-173]|uniref:ABC transporter ATP-binding protein n=1 Tax=Nocardioides sp. cx-173 TaxID=2898796 RepID=UPI001E515E39|nr:ABC transporter ATP-binding protein [Nocardioides sp. cx-173]MCD4523818.1 ABC transporter ATP-binding protein [Nocardioides sp. cx-173]UGB41861.1 ABC transporter ATP-binding protein [Nocardioides sp. cx-173]
MDTTTSSRADRPAGVRHREPAIRVRDLRRSYGSGKQTFEAVRGLDLDIEAGSVHALLGTNGAGKTSTMELIEGLGRPSTGEIRVLGLDPLADRAALRPRLGILLQRSGFSGDLTVAETLRMWHSTLSRPRPVADMLGALRLEAKADTRVVGLSGGEQRRLDLACTLMGRPEVVLLDEPTTGLDPESRRDVWSLIGGLRDEGVTVLLTTHYLEEAEALADELAIMHEGRIVRRGTVAQIVEGHPSVVRFRTPQASLPDLPRVRHRSAERGATVLETDDLQSTLAALLAWAERDGVRLADLSARTATLESVFLDVADHEGAPR